MLPIPSLLSLPFFLYPFFLQRLAKVIRDGELKQVSAEDLVVGDIVALDNGDVVPADGVLVEGIGAFSGVDLVGV